MYEPSPLSHPNSLSPGRVSRLDWKTNPRVSMNERRLSGYDDFRRRRSLRVAKFTSPLPFPFQTKGGESSLPLGSHAAFPQFLPSSLLLHRLLGGILIASTPPLETRPFPRVEYTTMRPSRKSAAAPGTGVIYTSTGGWDLFAAVSHAERSCTWDNVISKQLVARSIENVSRFYNELFASKTKFWIYAANNFNKFWIILNHFNKFFVLQIIFLMTAHQIDSIVCFWIKKNFWT